MKYEYCNDCPDHIEADVWEDHDLFGHVPYANGYCGRVLVVKDESQEKKPRWIYEKFARPKEVVPPIWCPYRGGILPENCRKCPYSERASYWKNPSLKILFCNHGDFAYLKKAPDNLHYSELEIPEEITPPDWCPLRKAE